MPHNPNVRAVILAARTCVKQVPTARSTGRNGRLSRCVETLLPAAMTQNGGKREGCSFNEIRCASSA